MDSKAVLDATTNSSDTNAKNVVTASQGIVVHALHKSATMFLFSFFQRIARLQGMTFYSPNLPHSELAGGAGALDPEQLPDRFCYCPQRSFVVNDSLDMHADVHRIFHIRDPRDILVSEYYSVGWIHPVEEEGLNQRRQQVRKLTIDEYALRQPELVDYPLEEKFRPLLERMNQNTFNEPGSNNTLVSYETMVTQFSTWARRAVAPFGFRMPAITVARLAWQYRNEFKPPPENASDTKMAHKRKITPGDFRNQLAPSTISQLNNRYEDILSAFNFAR